MKKLKDCILGEIRKPCIKSKKQTNDLTSFPNY